MVTLTAGALLVGVAALGITALLRPRGVVGFALGMAVVASAEVVAASYALSVFDVYRRGWLIGALGGAALIVLGALYVVRPPLPSFRRGQVIRGLGTDGALVVLGVVVLAEFMYLAALALFTPPTEYDALTYHLTRVIFWIQRDTIGPVPGVTDTRINEFPPDAEILQGSTMLLSGSIRFVGLVQLGWLLAAVLAIYGVACRVGFDRSRAAFGALLFPTLTVVALQAPTALNDLIVGALVAVTAFFALGQTRGEVALACLSLTLLVGTKSTGSLALPILVVLCVLTYRRAHLLVVLAAGSISVALGASWYVVNLASTGSVFGPAGESVRGEGGIVPVAARTTRYVVETFELPAGGRDVFMYAVAGVMLAAIGIAFRQPAATVLSAAGLAMLPLTVPKLEQVMHSVYWNGWTLVGYPEATLLGTDRGYAYASNLKSWYGPVGLALCVVSIVLVTRSFRRGELPLLAVLFAAAPVLFLLETAVTVAYQPFNGRVVMGGVALSATTWGIVRGSHAGAIATVAVAATTVLLALVTFNERPSGVDLLEQTHRPSIWRLPREWVQSIQPEVARIIGYVDDQAAPGDPVGVTRSQSVYPFAYVGWPNIEHRIVYADNLAEATKGGAGWAVLADTEGCRPGWRLAVDSPPWALWQRVRDAECLPR